MQDGQERRGHGDEGEQALGEVGDALLDDVGGAEGEGFFRVVVVGVIFRDNLGDAEGFGVEGGLRDQAVGEGQAE